MWSAFDIKKSFPAGRLNWPTYDSEYMPVDKDYLINEFLDDWRSHKIKTKMNFVENARDCDNFADSFRYRLIQAARELTHIGAQPAVGTLHVVNTDISLGIQKGSHILNIVGVTKGDLSEWIVVEPKNNLYVPLNNYRTASISRIVM